MESRKQGVRHREGEKEKTQKDAEGSSQNDFCKAVWRATNPDKVELSQISLQQGDEHVTLAPPIGGSTWDFISREKAAGINKNTCFSGEAPKFLGDVHPWHLALWSDNYLWSLRPQAWNPGAGQHPVMNSSSSKHVIDQLWPNI